MNLHSSPIQYLLRRLETRLGHQRISKPSSSDILSEPRIISTAGYQLISESRSHGFGCDVTAPVNQIGAFDMIRSTIG
jgi:hypothetical protein